MSEEEKLARNIQLLSNGKLEARNLDTCMTYGISGLCGKECTKFKDKTCEVYLDTLEREYNSLQNQLQQKENIIKEVREYIEKNKSKLPLGRNDFTCEMVYSDEVVLVNELLEILGKENK